MLTLHGHTGVVPALAFSPDGATLASGGRDGTVRLWLSGGAVEVFAGHTGPVLALAFRPDGRALASGGRDGWARFWPTAAGAADESQERKLPEAVTGLAYAPGGRAIWVGTGERMQPTVGGRVLCLDLTVPGRPLVPLSITEPKGVWALALSPDGQTVAWGTGGKLVRVWRPVSPNGPRAFTPLKLGCRALAVSPDGERLAAADDWDVKLYNLARHRELGTLKGHKGAVVALAWGPDGRTLASGSWDRSVRFWDPAQGRVRAVLPWPIGKVGAVACSPDGLRMAASGDEGTLLVWDLDEA
jgi:WD40 repeat protein